MPYRLTALVLESPIDVLDTLGAIDRIAAWARARDSRTVCLCNVHSVVTASDDAAFGAAVAGADLAVADGAPVAWMLRRLGHAAQRRIGGPDLMLEVCERAAIDGTGIYLYGSTDATLALLEQQLRARLPRLRIVGREAPPFRAPTGDEDARTVAAIRASGAGIVFVGLGCPKQELWMAAHRGRVPAVMVGVGAAFDFHAGLAPRAPGWVRNSGLEWLHRLSHDPRRLWRRYLETNSRFMLLAARQLWRRKGP